MNKNDQVEPSKALDKQLHALAAGLRDVIQETSDSYLKERPEDAYVDLACRLILRLRETLTILPVAQVAAARIRDGQLEAASRIFDIFTRWMREHPEWSYATKICASGKVELTFKVHHETRAFFQGESIQDAYAQAAQVIDFNGGEL
jgi:hypothetical protein